MKHGNRPIRIVVHSYKPGKELVAPGSLEAPSTPPSSGVKVQAEILVPGKNNQLLLDNTQVGEAIADKYGAVMFAFPVQQDGEKCFQLIRK